jgi:hypothetical protein
LPHPDDVTIEDNTGVRFIGPVDEESLARTESTVAHRHAFILQAALDERFIPQCEDGDLREGPGTAFEFAKLMNRSLPPRLRLSEDIMFFQVDRYSRHPKRWLLKEVYSTWRKLGKRFKRGQVFPNLGRAIDLLSLAYDITAAFKDGELDPDALARDQFESHSRAFLEERGVEFDREAERK